MRELELELEAGATCAEPALAGTLGAMTTEAETLEAMLAAERQWRADVLELMVRGVGYLEALAEASHGQLAALAEIRTLLTVDQAGEGEELEAVSVAELLERIAEDVEEAGTAAELLAPTGDDA